MRVAWLFLFADWPEKYFSGQSEGENSNDSGTGSVRVSAQGLSRSRCKLSPMKIPSSRLAAPGSLRMTALKTPTGEYYEFKKSPKQFCFTTSEEYSG